MGKRCIVCNKVQTSSVKSTYHSFPKDLNRRETWLVSLAIQKENLPRYAFVCSEHFLSTDFIVKPGGAIWVKKDAVPMRLNESPSSESSSIERQVLIAKRKVLSTSPKASGQTLDHSSSTLTVCSSSSTLTASPIRTGYSPNIHETTTSAIIKPCTKNRRKSNNPRWFGEKRKVLSTSPKASGQTLDHSSSTLTVCSSSSTLTASPTRTGYSPNIHETTTSAIIKPCIKNRRKSNNPRWFGDCDSDDMNDPIKAKRNWNLAKKTIANQRKKIKTLMTSRRRLQSRICNLRTLMTYLKSRNMITEIGQTMVNASLNQQAQQILCHFLKGTSKQKYTPELRSFALTLHFYSPKAYNYIRNKFNRSLPHPRTISKWYQAIDGAPGFTKEALVVLQQKVEAAAEKNMKIVCSLVLDEMAIRSQIEWTGNEVKGYVDMGSDINSDDIAVAKEALVLMLVAVNDHWKIPVGYFLLNGLTGTEKANLIHKCLYFLYETGVTVSTLTFDGHVSNINMCKELGVEITNVNNIKTSFKHPLTQDNIYVFLDPCHNIKLVRNCLGTYKCLHDSEGKQILWQYFEKLNQIQYEEGLRAGTKLKNRHIQWQKEKMKVKLATQTLSNSVSDALLYLCTDLQVPDFKGSEATAEFCKIFNNLFDILNVRNVLSKAPYGKPLSTKTATKIFEYLDKCVNYIKGLKINNVPILHSNRKTGFLGFLICIESLKQIYYKYVNIEVPLLRYILSYKFSQDHLEMFFSIIRSKGGFNNNPSARQFQTIYKRLMLHSEVKEADKGNCIALDSTHILHYSSGSLTKIYDQNLIKNDEYVDFLNVINDHNYLSSNIWHLTTYVSDIVSYIAGYVVKALKKCITCNDCKCVLESDTSSSSLQERKKFGKLTNASHYVITLCSRAEVLIRALKNRLGDKSVKISRLINTVLFNLPSNTYECFNDHIMEQDLLDNHHITLTKLILQKYFNIRMRHEAINLTETFTKSRVRSALTKSILFQNQ